MTIPSTARKAGPLLGTGAQTAWPFTFKVFAESDIAVTIADSLGVETALVLNTDYSVALNANQDTSPGGTVTYPISGSPLASGSVLSIVGDLDYDQPLDLPSGGNFSPLALENELDRLTMQIQQLKEQVGRAIQVSVTTDSDVSLPAPAASQLIGWDATGTSLENVPIESLATAVGYGTFTSDTFTGDGSTTQFTLSSDPATIGNVVVVVDGLTLTPVTDFTLVSGVVAFGVAPSLGAEIVVRHGEALPSGVANAQDVNYLPAGTGAVATTVQAKLRESVSVKDFGAVGDGVTDDTAAIQAAIDYALTQYIRIVAASGGTFPAAMVRVIFPSGVYKTSGTLTMNTGGYGTCVLEGEGQACIYYHGTGNAIYLRPIDPGLPLMTTPSQIRGLTFRGAGAKQGTAIYLETMTNGVVYNCNVYNFDVGIRISGAEAYDIDMCQQAIDTCNFGIIIEQSANQMRPNLCMIRNAYFISCSTKSVWIRNNGVGSGASGGVLSIRDVNFQGGSTIALHVDTPGEIAGKGTVSVDRCWFEGYGNQAVFLVNGAITFNNCFFTNTGTGAGLTPIYMNDTISKMDFYFCTFHASTVPLNNAFVSITNPTVNYPYLNTNVTTERLSTAVDGIPAFLIGYNGTIGTNHSYSLTQITGNVNTTSGATGSLAAAAYADVYDFSTNGGGQFIVTAYQADGGRVWRGFWVVSHDGVVTGGATAVQSQFITASTSGSMLRITNAHPTDPQSIAWAILRIG